MTLCGGGKIGDATPEARRIAIPKAPITRPAGDITRGLDHYCRTITVSPFHA